jgi:hypothetical protein
VGGESGILPLWMGGWLVFDSRSKTKILVLVGQCGAGYHGLTRQDIEPIDGGTPLAEHKSWKADMNIVRAASLM